MVFIQLQNPVYQLGEYLMQVSTPDELDRNPLLQPRMNSEVDYYVINTMTHSSGHCRLLNSYKARITSRISYLMFVRSVDCGVASHSVEHLFNCQSHPTQLIVQDLWDNPAAVADFLNLDN